MPAAENNSSGAAAPATLLRRCALAGCTTEFRVTEQAPHKKFCCAEHRNEFHGAELKAARAELRARKLAGAGGLK